MRLGPESSQVQVADVNSPHKSTWQIFPNAAIVPQAWPLGPGTQLIPVPTGQTQSTARPNWKFASQNDGPLGDWVQTKHLQCSRW